MAQKLAILKTVELYPLGEAAMGCPSYGMTINTNFGSIDCFKEIRIVIGSENYRKQIEQSACSRYLRLWSDFGTYIIDIKDQSISVFQITVRGDDGEWSEEQAVFGSQTEHVKGFSDRRTYYLQFPFVRKDKFLEVLTEYTELRKKQMAEARNAI